MLRYFTTAIALVLMTGCEPAGSSSEGDGEGNDDRSESARDAGRRERDRMSDMDTPRPSRPRPPPPVNKRPPPFKLSASHVLIQYEGADRAKATRTKEAAQELAQKVLARARKGESFEDLARENSDGPTKGRGGFLGAFEFKRMVPAFSKAVEQVEPNTVVSEVVESKFGYHVIRREDVMHVGHILVHFKGARRAHAKVTRDRAEAEKAINEARELMVKEGADWSAIALERSDCHQSKAVGGDLGYFGRDARLLPAMRKATGSLEPGEVSEVIETDYGFHVMFRFPAGVAAGGAREGVDEASPAPTKAETPSKATGPAKSTAPTKAAAPAKQGGEE